MPHDGNQQPESEKHGHYESNVSNMNTEKRDIRSNDNGRTEDNRRQDYGKRDPVGDSFKQMDEGLKGIGLESDPHVTMIYLDVP